MTKGRLWWAAVAALWLAGAGGGAAGGGPMLELTEQACGQEIPVAAGSRVRLTLPEQGGTGYLWQLRGLDETRLLLLEVTSRPQVEKELLGGPLKKIFLFSAKGAGRVALSLELRRPWEKEEPPLRKCTIVLNIF